MATIDMSVPHHLSQEEALARVKGLLEQVKSEHADQLSDLREEWSGNTGKFSLSAMGFAVSGTVVVTPSDLQLSGTLPFAAGFFKSRIESAIRDRATELLA